MVALIEGTAAPAILLSGIDGKKYDLATSLKESKLALVAFFHVYCPTCQYTVPFLEKLYRKHIDSSPGPSVFGISQHSKDDAIEYADSHRLTFPILIDDELKVSREYGLTNVPTIFLIDEQMVIQKTIVGFDKESLLDADARLSEFLSLPFKPLIEDHENVPAFKPG